MESGVSTSTEELDEEILEEVVEKKLTTTSRKALPDSSFALVYRDKKTGKKLRRFPIYDAAHARNALARLSQAKGLTPAQKATVKRKAQAALKKFTSGKYKPSKEHTQEQWNQELKELLDDYRPSEEEDDQEEIEITEENYEVLMGVIEDL